MKRLGLLLALLVACRSAGVDSERLADAAWHDGRWHDAATLYQTSGESPRVLAKLADAAVLEDSLELAASAFTRLGVLAPDRAAEAASGLARTAALAERVNSIRALTLAIVGLRRVEPGWPLGRLALRLAHDPGPFDSLARAIIPAALAAGPGRSAADSLLLTLGRAERVAGDCPRSVATLESAVRRSGGTASRDSASAEMGGCELKLGLAALAAARPDEAERWLDRVAQRDPLGALGRRALVGFGDARLAQGDLSAATLAWQTVAAAPVVPDSITALALERLRAGSPGAVTDSSRQGHP